MAAAGKPERLENNLRVTNYGFHKFLENSEEAMPAYRFQIRAPLGVRLTVSGPGTVTTAHEERPSNDERGPRAPIRAKGGRYLLGMRLEKWQLFLFSVACIRVSLITRTPIFIEGSKGIKGGKNVNMLSMLHFGLMFKHTLSDHSALTGVLSSVFMLQW